MVVQVTLGAATVDEAGVPSANVHVYPEMDDEAFFTAKV